jgi:hypothetical protein
MERRVYRRGIFLILIMALIVAVVQGNYYTSVATGADPQVQNAVILVLGIIAIALFTSKALKGALGLEQGILYVIFGGMLMRVGYVLNMDIWTLQNDGGTFTGFGTAQINNGHIGYVEYIYKFFHIPDMDPYEYFGYYHPPLHHIIEAIWMTIQRLIGVPEPLAFENMQVPTLIYSALCMIVMLHILEESGVGEKLVMFGMLLFAFHPRMMVLAGSVNNDILALLLLLTTIWRTLVWIRERSFKNIILIALSLGFGMISKLNTAICAFSIALIFVIVLIDIIRKKNLVTIKKTLLEFVVFGVICVPIGLSYIVRNLVLFGEKPGIPSPALIPNESVMYTGEFSVWSIIGIPSIADLHIDFPFHPLSAKVIHNTWVILFQTGLFAEAYPTTIHGFPLAFAQVAYVASIILAVVTTVVFIVGYTVRVVKLFGQAKAAGAAWSAVIAQGAQGPVTPPESAIEAAKVGDAQAVMGLRDLFLLSTYVFMLLSFCLYVFKYPYTCSSDFRYMTASLVFTSIGFGMCLDGDSSKTWQRFGKVFMAACMAATLIGSLLVYMNWEI